MTATTTPLPGVADAPNPSANFSSIPTLDYSLLSSPDTRPTFISQLRHALINVGFLYLSNHPVPTSTIDPLLAYVPNLFELSQDEREKIRMVNSPHFLGYSRLDAELTKGRVDHREQFDFGTRHETQWVQGKPEHWRMWGAAQWPEESSIPGFRAALSLFHEQVTDLSFKFTSLLAEALGLAPDALDKFFDSEEKMQHRSKIIKYPVITDPNANNQGVGPHYDAGFLTFLLQASHHRGLQVQNLSGEWIDVPPIAGTFVVNIGRGLEFVTQGLARATSHRVLSPRADPTEPVTPRDSIPFFQNIGLDIKLTENILHFPSEILQLKVKRGSIASTDSVNFSEFDRESFGHVSFIGRVKSHPDVAERFYPDIFKEYFPDGLPSTGIAY